jgi:hypothetical protein
MDQIHSRGLLQDAVAYAHRRARREFTDVHVYQRDGIVFVRADNEPQPDNSELIYTATLEGSRLP